MEQRLFVWNLGMTNRRFCTLAQFTPILLITYNKIISQQFVVTFRKQYLFHDDLPLFANFDISPV